MIKKFFKLIFKILLGLFLFSIMIVVIYKWVPVPFTPLMVIRYFENPGEPVEHDWVPIEDISRHLQLAVIASEDQNFANHSGFDFEAIQKAMDNNRSGRKIRGASTISQQTAKNVFLWPGRTWFRKGVEAYFTFLIEMIWSKERILEVYLNSIEMGKGVYGAQAASQHWFKKDAIKLGPYEAAAIAAVLPNPREYRANPASNFIQRRKNWIVRQMQNYGKFMLE
ncbi:monofunctional biosynthetic peptidoglycan transglycosylase [Christiangramia sabulilitoris]|uniref:Biosynthetic peptidoglycan transglycosylase n=1 Tax=Christiangramia sabulilitoris TaxID=2583991 RepID=A0A550I8X0_9FLAO|nr:monofunctional biosynthetic peptidoglycan transglycosylase [Christiangramia sabulilitoris]TRO67421.1 monofunctional biosynthetic peptidoglycan transglycosylase [Christiangramia sabulilitoris]